MKMKEMFIGQIVVADKDSWRHPNLPKVGKVVDIDYEYQYDTLITSNGALDREIRVLPVVHFLGESYPRSINPSNIEPYRSKE